MGFNLQSSHYVVLLVCLLAVSVLAMVGFLNNVYAANNMTVGTNMSMKANASANMTGNMTKTMTGNMTKTTSIIPKILPPLQQLKSGVVAKGVQCNAGLTLIIKAEDGSPACVTSQTAQTLTARGWGTAP
jgi:hypothetical protein